jgi:hypothetical protein
MTLAGHIVSVEDELTIFQSENVKTRDHTKDTDIDENNIINSVLKEKDVRGLTEFICSRIIVFFKLNL